MALKVTHVIHHLDARDLRHRLSVSDSDLFDLARERVHSFRERLASTDLAVVLLHASEKSRSSTILKLLAKRQTLAAKVYDRIRFRVIVKRRGDVLPVLLWMTRMLFPFNYVVPHESRNDLLNFTGLLEAMDRAHPGSSTVHDAMLEEQERVRSTFHNEFSHPDFQMINFVVDLPLPADRFVTHTTEDVLARFGRTLFLLVEFQVYDMSTFMRNETGPSSHAHYKARQRRAILKRLVGAGRAERWRQPTAS